MGDHEAPNASFACAAAPLKAGNLACSTMQNLREAIAGYRTRLMHEGHEGKRNSLLEVCISSILCYRCLGSIDRAVIAVAVFSCKSAQAHSTILDALMLLCLAHHPLALGSATVTCKFVSPIAVAGSFINPGRCAWSTWSATTHSSPSPPTCRGTALRWGSRSTAPSASGWPSALSCTGADHLILI